jgi:hypothetical protein
MAVLILFWRLVLILRKWLFWLIPIAQHQRRVQVVVVEKSTKRNRLRLVELPAFITITMR